jgi:hypothetical protein
LTSCFAPLIWFAALIVYRVSLSSLPYSHLCIFGYKLAWPGRASGLVPTAAKHRHTYTNIPTTHLKKPNKPFTHPLASFQIGIGCTLLQHPTSPALITSPTPRQSELVCGACIGTAQVGASLAVPLGFMFKRSSLRSSRDMIIIPWHM